MSDVIARRPSGAVDMSPRATYRLQFHKDFPFSAGRALAGYLADLGVSHLYSSPILTARAGSLHGYDVIDYDAISPELGGEAEFIAMSETLRDHGIGIILDIVPNHMAVGGDDNRLWLDLLKHGRDSDYATWFDVDFDCPDPQLRGKVHAPFLGRPYAEALANGELKLVESPRTGGYAIRYGENLFPIRPESDAEIEAAGIETFADAAHLDRLISEQNYRLDWWRNAGDRINWRRFFDITQLAAVRMEIPAAFAAKHAVSLKLYREGHIDGLRIDHIDGLGDPAAYALELRRQLDALQPFRPAGLRAERAYVVVEKILASGEAIPGGWDVAGSTGYDFMNEVNVLQHDVHATEILSDNWASVSGRTRDFGPEEVLARREILDFSFDGQRDRLIDYLEEAGAAHRSGFGLTRPAMRRAITSLIAEFRAYRSYATGRDDGSTAGDRFEDAFNAAHAAPLSDGPALQFIRSVLMGEGDASLRSARIEAIRRFNQLSAPLAAKAVEDTAFYRYGRLLSRNDVGFDAETLGIEPGDFHRLMQVRARDVPLAMLTTATHDHKRGEDVRARLSVLSEMPDAFIAATSMWREMNQSLRPAGLDPADEYMLYQMIVGAWDFALGATDAPSLAAFADRLAGWARKALREGKLRSSWAQPNEAYEAGFIDYLTELLTPAKSAQFLSDINRFIMRIAPAGAANGLVQLTLRGTVPGVPDTYQGTEFWDFSLVDPDNRRPVDFATRIAALSAPTELDQLTANWRDGRVKQAILRRLLHFRRDEPALFAAGDYEPLEVTGPRARNVVAFVRRHEGRAMLVVTARLIADGLTADGLDAGSLAPTSAWWNGTRVVGLPMRNSARSVIGPELSPGGDLDLAKALPFLPLAVWSLSLT